MMFGRFTESFKNENGTGSLSPYCVSSFAKSIGEQKASIVDSTAFALTHISHFGLVYINSKWTFFTTPTIIWVTAMFLASILFFRFKKRSASIWGAIICHSAFNLEMIYCIFYLI